MGDTVNRRISIYIDAVQAELQLKKLAEREQTLIKAQGEIKQGSAAWKANAAEIEKIQKQMGLLNDQLSGKVGPSLAQLTKLQKQLNDELKRMPVELRKGSDEFKKLQQVQGMIAGVRKETAGTASTWNSFTSQAKASMAGFVGGSAMVAGINLVGSSIKSVIDNQREFEVSLKNLSAITGAAGEDLDYLADRALKVGMHTNISARDTVEAYKLIASAKPELLNDTKALADFTEQVIALSQASGLDLPEAATRLTDAMNQFGAPAEEAGRYVNILAEGAKLSAAEIPDITDALLKFGVSAKSSNITIAESTALIETLAEKGLKGAEAGTQIRNVFAKLSAPETLPREALKYLEAAGVNLDKLKDTTIPLVDRIDELGKIQGNAGAIAKVFGLENKNAAQVMIENRDRVRELSDALGKDGLTSAYDQAATNTDTLDNSLKRLSNTWDSILTKGGTVSNLLKGFVDYLTKALVGLNNIGAIWDQFTSTTFGKGVQSMKDSTKDAILEWGTIGETSVAAITAPFEKMSDAQFLQKFKENKKQFTDELVKQGIELKDAADLFDYYAKKRTDALIKAYKAPKQQSMLPGQNEDAGTGEGGYDKTAAKEKAKMDKLLDNFRSFQREVEQIQNEAAAAAESKNDAEIEKVTTKYQKLLQKAKEHYSKLPQLADEYFTVLKQLDEAEYNDKLAVYDKQIDAAQKAYDKDVEAFFKSEKTKTEKLKKESAERIQAAYDSLIGSKNAEIISGKTDGSLSKQDELDKKKEVLLLETQALLENDKLTAGQRKEIWAQYYADVKQLDDDWRDQQIQAGFEFANQFGSVMASMNQIKSNEAQKSLQQEEKSAKRTIKNLNTQKEKELALLEEKNKQGLFKTDEYEAQKAAIEKKYEESVRKVEEETERQRIMAQRDSAEREKRLAIFNTIVNTAAAIVKMLADPGGVLGAAMSIGAGIAGAVQLSAINSTPLPQFNTGGATMSVVGSNTGRTYQARHIGSFKNGGRYTNASYGIIGEEGTELVIPNWMYKHPKMFDMMNFLEYNISKGKTFAEGGPTIPSTVVQPNYNSIPTDPAIISLIQQINALVIQNIALNKALLDQLSQPIQAAITYDHINDSSTRMDKIKNTTDLDPKYDRLGLYKFF